MRKKCKNLLFSSCCLNVNIDKIARYFQFVRLPPICGACIDEYCQRYSLKHVFVRLLNASSKHSSFRNYANEKTFFFLIFIRWRRWRPDGAFELNDTRFPSWQNAVNLQWHNFTVDRMRDRERKRYQGNE